MIAEKQVFIIGLNTYRGSRFRKLDNAALDAKRFKIVLTEQYGFVDAGIYLNEEGTRAAIINELDHICKSTQPEDTLIIYFAGHGWEDPDSGVGFWIPIDGSDAKSTWISNQDILEKINSANAKHILLVSDACFSGTFTTSDRMISDYSPDTLDSLGSRWILTSGRVEAVGDGSLGVGSPFSSVLCGLLENSIEPAFTAAQLFEVIRSKMAGVVPQQPTYSAYVHAGHHWGQVVFRREQAKVGSGTRSKATSWPTFSLPDSPALPYTIPRPLTVFEVQRYHFPELDSSEKPLFLRELIATENRAVLLGSDGSGKSVEFMQTASNLQQGRQFVPIYVRFNLYVNEDIKDYLPRGWDGVPTDQLALFFDALDEAPDRNTAVRKINRFAQDHPTIRIVVSCRTNQYSLPTKETSGTLSGFPVYQLKDISLAEAGAYAARHAVDGKKFLQAVRNNGLTDLIGRPYFLDILVQRYQAEGRLTRDRAALLEDALLRQSSGNLAHFQHTATPPLTKEELFDRLTRAAFVMELMGRNFLLEEEMHQVFNDSASFHRLSFLPALTRLPQYGRWQFDHNNLQEYLAARFLLRLGFDDLLEVLTFKDSQKVKPTWVNTMAFFISIAHDDKAKPLIDWVKEHDPEFVIRFERDQITAETRFELAKHIIDSYNARQIGMVSNKFSDADFAAFAASLEFSTYLIDLLNDPRTSVSTKINNIRILTNTENNYLPDGGATLKAALLRMLKEQTPDPYFTYSLFRALGYSRVLSVRELNALVRQFRIHKNEYIRAGLYFLILNQDQVDRHLTVFLDGLDLTKLRGAVEDRGDSNLMDEDFLLRQALQKVSFAPSLKKLFNQIATLPVARLLSHREAKEVYVAWIDRAVALYPSTPSLYNTVFRLFRFAGQSFNDDLKNLLLPFFEQTNTARKAFEQVMSDRKTELWQRFELVAALLDMKKVHWLIAEHKAGKFTAAQMRELHRGLLNTGQKALGISLEQFEQAVNAQTDLALTRPQTEDWGKIQAQRTQESYDLLFDAPDFKREIRAIFQATGKDPVHFDDVIQVRQTTSRRKTGYYQLSAIQFLRNCLHPDRSITVAEALGLVDSWYFQTYRLEEAYRNQKEGGYPVRTNSEQEKALIEWVKEYVAGANLALMGLHQSERLRILWYFVEHYKIDIAQEKLLSFSALFDFSREHNFETPGAIDALAALVPEAILHQRVIENLQRWEPLSWPWLENAAYALRKRMAEVYPLLIDTIRAATGHEFRLDSLIEFVGKQPTAQAAFRDLAITPKSIQVRQEVMDQVLKVKPERAWLTKQLFSILTDPKEDLDMQLYAAGKLVGLQQTQGLAFLVERLEAGELGKEPNRQLPLLITLQSADAIPLLIRLLLHCKRTVAPDDPMDFLQSKILDGFFSVGTQSAENLLAVKTALTAFIRDHSAEFGNLNYLLINLERMEGQYLLKRSSAMPLLAAIKEYDRLRF